MSDGNQNRGSAGRSRRGVKTTVSLLALAAALIYLGFIARSVLGI